MRLGYAEEANAFMRWVKARADCTGADGSMQIMYRMDGSKQLEAQGFRIKRRAYG